MKGRLHTQTGLVPAHMRTRVAELLQAAIGGASPARARDLVASHPAVVLCMDDRPVAAAIGREIGGGFVIQAIAAEPSLRRRGLGRRLLEEISRTGEHAWIEAETDRDSVEFYRRCGFTITSLGEKYPGVKRFSCRIVLPGPHAAPVAGDASCPSASAPAPSVRSRPPRSP